MDHISQMIKSVLSCGKLPVALHKGRPILLIVQNKKSREGLFDSLHSAQGKGYGLPSNGCSGRFNKRCHCRFGAEDIRCILEEVKGWVERWSRTVLTLRVLCNYSMISSSLCGSINLHFGVMGKVGPGSTAIQCPCDCGQIASHFWHHFPHQLQGDTLGINNP